MISYDTNVPLTPNTFLHLKNLPAKVTLTEGYRVSKQTWAIPLDRLAKLRIQYPDSAQLETTIRAQLVSLEGEIQAQKDIRLIVGIAPLTPPKLASKDLKRASQVRRRAADVMSATANLAIGDTKTSNPTPPATQPAPALRASPASGPTNKHPEFSPSDRARALRFMSKGDEFLLQGNISTARLFYRRSADLGMAPAAMALAATYDPNELSKLGIVGLQGDPKEARNWYARAAELGSKQAPARLRRLSN